MTNKYYKIYDGYDGMDPREYPTVETAKDAAKIRSQSRGRDRLQYPVVILQAVGTVKVPVPQLEVEDFV